VIEDYPGYFSHPTQCWTRKPVMNRTIKIAFAAALFGAAVCNSASQAAFFSYPRVLNLQLNRIRLESAALAPIAYSRFCMQYHDDCEIHRMAFRRPRPAVLTTDRMRDLIEVNRDVNRSIIGQESGGGVLTEHWVISPKVGECHDYAVTKRHELLERGWASRSLLLAEVVVPWGEGHLVLVVRTDQGDLVLDNLNAGIKPWSRTPYKWVRVQSPDNPNFWMTVAPVTHASV
jgi:predicted transglutaminase-like cysteine proteinase